MRNFYLYISEEPDDFQSAWMTIVTASYCTLIGSSHGIPPVTFVLMTGSHHGNDNDDWQSAHNYYVISTWTELWWLEVIMGTIVMSGSQHKCCFNVDSCDDWKSSWNDSDDWQLAEKVCPAPLPRASTMRILVFTFSPFTSFTSFTFSPHSPHSPFRWRLQIAAGKYLSRFPANQHIVVVTNADWKSSRAPRSCTNKTFASRVRGSLPARSTTVTIEGPWKG